ncbi:efflux RND transporter permease subunit [Altererythrobacter indicus]|uniref:Efflux pump membrane transporter n=1 Tax=Altericroceibacterium indicum TaxID=374177 RepID=A0A845A993_9SPHN|nr:efflux RND transporter permease subunit [Altericroceibacterium indicum]MXP25581.1 efflux RND transporter permease subunit [Altericroceibacterium indicum]
MNISRFFVDRPIFAWVIAIAVVLTGIGSIMSLSIAQYPDIAPPTVNIRANYPGASAETLESSVTQIIEQQLTGIDNMLYFSSTSSSAGSVSISVTFDKGTDPDVAQVQVQNKVQQATSRLPSAVQQQGVSVTKSASDFLMLVTVYDKSGKSSSADIGDYLVSNFQDPVGRVNGVGQTRVFGSQYAMRIWLDPIKLAAVKLMPSDVKAAILAQNTEVSAGQIGDLPATQDHMLNAVVKAKSRFNTPEQFRNIVLKTQQDGSVVHLGDVAKVEIGSESYVYSAQLNGYPASGMALQLAPGADALSTAAAVKEKVAELSSNLPEGYAVAFPRDTSSFVKQSVYEVIETLVIAIILVVLVMFVFLQSWRATLIPAIAVPVVLMGTFGVLAAFGYSINTLTLFGMVLAIGLLVDDAIVVVENVERLMTEEGLAPREATVKSMDEISSALIGIALVLSAVMLPMAFFGGSTGVIYRQFSITVVSAMLLSVLVALILSPALCATLLKPGAHAPNERKGFFGKFNRWFDRKTDRYLKGVESVTAKRLVHFAVYGVILIAMVLLFIRLPTSFLPSEDQGEAMVMYTLPAGATIERTNAVRKQIEKHYFQDEKDNVAVGMVLTGFSFNGQGQNTGIGFIGLKPFNERKGNDNSISAINARAMGAFRKIRDAQVIAMVPPAIRGLGQSNGFSFELQNNSGMPRAKFEELRDRLIAAANASPKLIQVRKGALDDAPQLRIDIDEEKLAVLGLSEKDVTDTLSSAWGGSYVNDFVDRGRVKRVYIQGVASSRMVPSDIDNWFVRSSKNGNMVPFSAFATTHWEKGPSTVSRFDGLSSYTIQGQGADGVSSGDAMKEIVRIQKEVAPGTSYAWSGLSFQENQSTGQAPLLYGLSVLVVFLCLAALYESWSVPLAVLLVLPLGIIGAVIAVSLRGLDNDIYFQVGLLTTIGLAAKNAILIIEFAETARREGKALLPSALEGARLRLRPILMTSIAFIAGVMPLALASGVGAESRIAIGTAVVGGMLTATAIAIFYVPLFFIAVSSIFHRAEAKPQEEAA